MANKNSGYDRNDYVALKNGNIGGLIGEMRHDAADDAALFFARELDFVKSKAYDKLYPKFTALQYFPHSSEVDPGAETTTYYSYDKVGMAQIINNYATDLPRADAKGKPSTSYIKSVGVSYGYSIQEMRASKFTGKSLDARKAESARYQIDYILNKIAWAGDKDNNILGVLSEDTQIPEYTIDDVGTGGAHVTAWIDKDADQILNDVRNWTTYVSKLTKDVETPDSLLLPTDVYMDIATRRIPHTETTVLAYLLDKSPYLKNINSAAELNDDCVEINPYAAASEGLGVAFLYTYDKDKFTIEDPLAFIQHPAQVRNLETVVPCEARTAGLICYYPMSALIIKGVSKGKASA